MTKRRVLLKLSGEALIGDNSGGIDKSVLDRLAAEIDELCEIGTELAIVIGGGNILRGAEQAAEGMDRVTSDQMGMLATIIIALAMCDALDRLNRPARVMSAIRVSQLCEDFSQRRALHHLNAGRVVIFAGGTGNPFFTTDSAASLRAVEIGADLLIKATKVDGVYSADPLKQPDARFYPRLSYDDALDQKLAVMDATALVLCRDNNMPLTVMNIFEPGAIKRLIEGEAIGSLITTGE